jgi:hypothetical protein
MKYIRFLQDAKDLVAMFSAVLQEDSDLDAAYNKNKSEIEIQYKSKLAELEKRRSDRMSVATAKHNSANANIQAAFNALEEAAAALPQNYIKKYNRSSQLSPKTPDFQKLHEMALRIEDTSLSAFVKRLSGTEGYSSKADMVTEYLDSIEAGRLYLEGEVNKSRKYLAQEKSASDMEYNRDRAILEQKKSSYYSQNDHIYNQSQCSLETKLLNAINNPRLAIYEENLIFSLEQLGAFDDTWSTYEPSVTYPSDIMLGAVTVPLKIPSPVDLMVQEKMPTSFKPERGICVPMTVGTDTPLRLLVNYDERCKSIVMEGIQSIILKWIRFMPPYSFSITYIDPIDRGTNLGKLQRLEEITSWDICKKVYASREDITKRLKELEHFVDITCSRLAGIRSAYDYNSSIEPEIVQHLIVFNDYPEKIDRAAEEALDVLINNASKCGISMIFTKKGNLSELPPIVLNSFLRINASVNGNTIPIDNKMYDFQFDNLCSTCEEFIDGAKAIYNEGFKVDNSFGHYFTFAAFNGYKESTDSLYIPFAVDSRKRLVELELGGALTAHALLSGSTGSGKSTTLHMLITSIVLNYHPDDVELWLVDYNKVEFAEYITNMPPHVKLIGLENGAEFTFSLLEKLNEECQRRMELFKSVGVSDITEYKKTFGVNSLPRIILIIDEFHQMTQAIQNEPEYVLILENILSEYRKFGLSCVFSDQAISVGLKGLTEKGKKQIRTRIAMANDMSEIRETLSLDNSYYDETLKNKINRMDKGDVIFKRGFKDSSGETQIVIDKYRTVYTTRKERVDSIAYAKTHLVSGYRKTEVLIVDGKGRKTCDEDAIQKYETVYGGPTSGNIPIYVGTPANLNPFFSFALCDRLDSNIMVIGSDTEMRASVVLFTVSCFARLDDYEIVIIADEKDELYRQYRKELESLQSSRIHIVTEASRVCPYADGLLDRARQENQPQTLLVWLGLESIGAELSMFPEKNSQSISGQSSSDAVNDLIDEIDSMLADIGGTTSKGTGIVRSKSPEKVQHRVYDARNDISELITKGSRYGIHSLVTYPSVKMLRQSRFVRPECFEHKIAFKMSRDDWSNYMERIPYIAELDDITAAYFDGGSTVHLFRPYLF